jgi:hypothetical protein
MKIQGRQHVGDEVEYPTEYMTSLANTRQTRWDTDSSEGIKKIRDALADESSFGEVPVLASYGRVFSEVRKIYLETLRCARLDLDSLAQGIKTSARQMKDNDDAAGAAFLELWQRWEQGPLESTRHQSEASSTQAAQDAAADADSAEGATGALPQGEVPDVDDSTVANPDTRSEGEIPTGGPDAPPPQ